MKLDTRRKFLKNIKTKGVAGVDHPAHLHEGWAIMKEKGVPMDEQLEAQLNELLSLAEKYAEQHTGLTTALVGAEEYLDEAPDHVKQAAIVLYHYLHAVETAEVTGEEASPEATVENTTQVEVAAATAKSKSGKPGLMARIAGKLAKGAVAPAVEVDRSEDTTAETVTPEAAVEQPADEEKVEEIDFEAWLAGLKDDIKMKLREEEA